MNNKLKSKAITNIAIGIAAVIGGGLIIFQFSTLVPMPGMKFILMAPYLSMMFYILQMRLISQYSILQIGGLLGCIMSIINIFMGISIILTSLFSMIVTMPFQNKKTRAAIGSIAFSGFSAITGLTVSKVFIGGIYDEVTIVWMMISFSISLILGGLGAFAANKMTKYFGKLINN